MTNNLQSFEHQNCLQTGNPDRRKGTGGEDEEEQAEDKVGINEKKRQKNQEGKV